MANLPIRILSQVDIQACISMPVTIGLMHQAFCALSTRNADVPIRAHLHLTAHQGEMLCMPVYLPEIAKSGLKLVGVQPSNPARGLPMIQAAVLLMNAETGQLQALMDGTFITALRTGAGIGLATDLLARPDAKIAALFGTGAQAFHQLEAICAVRKFERIWIYNRTPANAQAFIARHQDTFDAELLWTDDLTQLKEVDVICTATTSLTPLFDRSVLKAGVHINGVGSYRPDMAEIAPDIVTAAQVVVDQTKACLHEAGDIIQAIEAGIFTATQLYGELGEIAAGLKAGRTDPDTITFFKSVGNAAQDLIVAHYIYEQASTRNLGTLCDW